MRKPRQRLEPAQYRPNPSLAPPFLQEERRQQAIHVNPFLVTHVNGERHVTPEWRDTYPLGPHLGDSFTFTMNLEDFAGMTVQHCHVLAHEDLGMMEAVEIV